MKFEVKGFEVRRQLMLDICDYISTNFGKANMVEDIGRVMYVVYIELDEGVDKDDVINYVEGVLFNVEVKWMM